MSSLLGAQLVWAMPLSAPAFDPATLSLDGYWRANYGGAPWSPTASAGTSGSNGNLSAGSAPAVGAAVNGLTPASFNGSTNYLQTASAASTYMTTSAFSGFALVNVASIATNAGSDVANDTVFCTTGTGQVGIYLRSNGTVTAFVFTGGNFDAVATFTTGAWQLVQWTFNATTLRCRVNGGAWTSTAVGANVNSLSATLDTGRSALGSQFMTGKMLELASSKTVISDANFDNVRAGLSARYGISV